MVAAHRDYPVRGSQQAGDRYDDMWRRLLAAASEQVSAVHAEATVAQTRLAELSALDWQHRTAVIDGLASYHSPALAWLLLDRSAVVAHADPWQAERLAQLSLHVVAHLCPRRHPASLRAGLVSRSWTSIADARRRLGDWNDAEKAFGAAQIALAATGDPLEEAEFCRCLSLLRRQQARAIEAEALMSRAMSLRSGFA